MNKVAIITSVDYELFGDGSGIVMRDQIKTTNYLKDLAESNGIKLTIMFEYAQYRTYKKYASELNKFAEANKKIDNQLIELIKSGHDVQLHYHGQWHDAVWDEELEAFKVNLNQVDVSSLEYAELVSVLKEGKEFLEQLLRPYKNDYECLAFRAGSWAVENEEKFVKALSESGFKIDTSVVPNVKFQEGFVTFEYSNCPHYYHYWYISKQISKESKDRKILEIPIYTIKDKFSFFKYISLKSILVKSYIKSIYRGNIYSNSSNLFQKIKNKLSRNYYMADINAMTSKTLIAMVDHVIHDDKFKNDKIIPIMMVGHSKASYRMEELELLYSYLGKNYGRNVEYWTLQDVANKIMDKKIDTHKE